jgi:hypothetical protein
MNANYGLFPRRGRVGARADRRAALAARAVDAAADWLTSAGLVAEIGARQRSGQRRLSTRVGRVRRGVASH